MKTIILTTLAFFVGCSTINAEPSLEQHIDALFSTYTNSEQPGYAVGVIRNGKLIIAKGYGLADLEAGQPVTADTAFNLASLSKQFTGAAIVLELERGRIELDDPLADHWPGLPDFMSDIAIGHLVYMTSGLKEYYSLPSPKGGWASEDQFNVDDAMGAVFASRELDYTPGTRWTYSNINYQLLAVLTARLNNRSFGDHMKTSVFEPLNMERSWVDAPLDRTRLNIALSYIRADDDSGWQIAPRLSPHFGGSGVFSSINDLAKWDTELYGNNRLGVGFSERMLSTRRFDHKKDNDAFGLVHGSYEGLDTIWYEGGDYGVSTYMVRIPERNETIICLSNFGQGRCRDKARAIIDVLIELELDKATEN